VAVVGEAGVGKSRLVYEFIHSHRTQGWLILEAVSVSYGKATPYFPVAELLRRYVHIEDGDEPRTMRAKVTGQVLTLDQALQDAIPSLLALLNVLPGESPFARLDPPRKRQRTLEALKRLVLRESELQPLLLVFEDLHWIDSESQALLDSLVDSLPTARLVLVVNYRPEYRHAWGSKTYYTQLRLDPLPPESAEALLDTLLGDDPGLAALKQRLIARTEGNPFFLEEMVQTLVETQVLVGERGAYRLAQEALTIQMPATVQAVLAARIDRLPADAKRLLQTAAVIGADVPLELLQTIVALSEGALQQGLTHLQAAEFLYETHLFPERVYTFKHALTHEVAYGSLLQERRRVLHARIVDVLEMQHGDRLPDQVERLAYHAWRGEIWDKAVAYARQAGSQAAAHSAYREAAACYEQALAALRHVPDNRRAHEQIIDLHVALRSACHALGENWQYFDHLYEAEKLAIAIDDQRRQAQASNNLATCYWWVGDYERARTYIQQGITVAETLGDVVLQLYGRYILGLLYVYQGSYGQALDGFRWVITTSKADPSLDYLSSGSGGSIVTFSHVALSLSQAEYGTFTEGLAYGTEGIRRAETVDHLYSRILGQTFVGFLYLRKGEIQEAVQLLESGLALCRSGNMPRFVPDIASFLGAALTLGGRLVEALMLMEDAVQQGDAMHFMAGQALRVAHLGEAYGRAGRVEEALRQAQRALQLARAHQERGHEAYALRLFGDIAMQNKPLDFDQAATHYHQALARAETLDMRPLQAHCHRGLGRLYCQTGQAEHARAELSTAIEMYRDMAMTLWLPETEAALAQVEER
jgi:tetratricopeptide (TPR) repeat protein